MIQPPAERQSSFFARARQQTGNLLTAVKDNQPFASTSTGRNIARSNVGMQLINYAAYSTYPLLLITKISQFMLSGFILTRENPRASEKWLYLVLATIAAVQSILVVILFIEDYVYEFNSKGISCAYIIFDCLFTGVLGSGWIPSEFSKLYNNTSDDPELNEGFAAENHAENIEIPRELFEHLSENPSGNVNPLRAHSLPSLRRSQEYGFFSPDSTTSSVGDLNSTDSSPVFDV